MANIFSLQDIFLPGIYLHAFFPLEISLHDIFSKITHSPVKGQMVYQTFGQLTDAAVCQSFLKAFETIGDKTL